MKKTRFLGATPCYFPKDLFGKQKVQLDFYENGNIRLSYKMKNLGSASEALRVLLSVSDVCDLITDRINLKYKRLIKKPASGF
jgi:hypothetical protein